MRYPATNARFGLHMFSPVRDPFKGLVSLWFSLQKTKTMGTHPMIYAHTNAHPVRKEMRGPTGHATGQVVGGAAGGGIVVREGRQAERSGGRAGDFLGKTNILGFRVKPKWEEPAEVSA